MKRLLYTVKKRPAVFFFMAVVAAIFCGAEQFNSFARKFGTFKKLFELDYSKQLTAIAEWAKMKAENPMLMLSATVITILMFFAVCAIFAALYSGFSYVMYVQAYTNIHPSDKNPKKTTALIKEGINKRFGGMMLYFVIFLSTAIVGFILMLYGFQPAAMSIAKVIGGDASAMLGMIVMTAITVIVWFFVLSFYAMYMTFMKPSIIAFKKGAIRVAVKIVNSYSWYLIPRTLAFLAYNVGVYFLLLAMSYGTVTGVKAAFVFMVNWLLRTIGIVIYSNYVFHTFIEMKDDLFQN